MTDVAFAPTWQRKPPRRFLAAAICLAVVALVLELGPRAIVDYRDLTCPVGYGARPVSIAYWAVQCQPNGALISWPQSAPISRYAGLFLTGIDMRVFDVDFLGGGVHGPGLRVHVR